MRTKLTLKVATALLSLSTINPQLSICLAQGTAFTYQGRLNDDGAPANGIYDLRFAIYDSSGGAGLVSGPLTKSPTAVTNGLFAVTLDFGVGVFTGADRWLDIGVRSNGGGAFTALSPRQKLTATPYALSSASLSGPLPAAQLAGTVSAAALPAGGNWALNSTLTLDATTLAVDPINKRVGIGTGSPSTALTVQPAGSSYGIEHTDGERRLSTYLDAVGCWFGTVSPHPLHFFVNNGGSALTIDTAGRVGIGSASPTYPLHLVGDLGGARFDSTANPNGSVLELRNTMASPNYLGAINFNNAAGTFPGQIGYLASHDLVVRTAGAERLRVDGNGRVGIGTADPQTALHVNGSVKVEGTVTVAETTRYLSVPPSGWVPEHSLPDDHVGFYYWNAEMFAYKHASPESGNRDMRAPLQLPHGATIVGMYARVLDINDQTRVVISLQRHAVLANEAGWIANMFTTPEYASGVTIISPAAPFTLEVNNQFYSYDLVASAGVSTYIGTVVIRYTVTDPLP